MPEATEAPVSKLDTLRINETRYRRVYTRDEVVALIKKAIIEEAHVSSYKPSTIAVGFGADVDNIAVEMIVIEPEY